MSQDKEQMETTPTSLFRAACCPSSAQEQLSGCIQGVRQSEQCVLLCPYLTLLLIKESLGCESPSWRGQGASSPARDDLLPGLDGAGSRKPIVRGEPKPSPSPASLLGTPQEPSSGRAGAEARAGSEGRTNPRPAVGGRKRFATSPRAAPGSSALGKGARTLPGQTRRQEAGAGGPAAPEPPPPGSAPTPTRLRGPHAPSEPGHG